MVFRVLLCNVIRQQLFIASNDRTDMLDIYTYIAYYHDWNCTEASRHLIIWRPPLNYLAAATYLSGGRHLIIWRPPLNYPLFVSLRGIAQGISPIFSVQKTQLRTDSEADHSLNTLHRSSNKMNILRYKLPTTQWKTH